MTLPYLGGAGENLSGLNQIADVIGSILKPNAKFEHQMKALFIEKPELMQKFVDIEKANPGTLKAFGFGEAGSDLLSRMQESIPGLVSRSLAPKIAEELQRPDSKAVPSAVTQAISGQTPGQLEADDFSAWFSKTGGKLLKENPELFVRAARAKFGTGTELENELEDRTLEGIQSEGTAKLRELPPMEIVNRIAAGTLDPVSVSGLLNGPEGPAIQVALALYRDEREAVLRRGLASLGNQGTALERAKLAAAFDAWQGANGKGSLAGWYAHLYPGEKLPPGLGVVQPGDPEAIAGVLEDSQRAERVKQLQNLYKAVKPIIDEVDKRGARWGQDPENENAVDRINTLLEEHGSPWRAEWDEAGWTAGRIRYFNGNEETRDPSVLLSPIAPGDVQNRDVRELSNLSTEQQAIVRMLQNATGANRAAMIQQIRASATPEDAEKIIRLGGGE